MTAMISALALLSSDRLGLVERNRVEHIQHLYACVLQNYVQGTKKHNVSAFAVSYFMNSLGMGIENHKIPRNKKTLKIRKPQNRKTLK